MVLSICKCRGYTPTMKNYGGAAKLRSRFHDTDPSPRATGCTSNRHTWRRFVNEVCCTLKGKTGHGLLTKVVEGDSQAQDPACMCF